VSIKELLTLATLAIAALLAASAGLSLYVFTTAEGQLERALMSYEQLAIATGLETDAARAMLFATRAPAEGSEPGSRGLDREGVSRAIDTLIEEVREEIGSLADPGDQAEEAEEFVAAFSIREDYRRLFRLLDAQPPGQLPSDEAFRQYAELDDRLGFVVGDERSEVANAIASVAAFRDRLEVYSVAATAVILLAIVSAATLTYRFLMRPLRILESGSAQLAEGNIAHRIEALGPPELRRLAASLNEMAERLQLQQAELRDSNVRLEETVAARTTELADKAERLQTIDKSRRLFFAKVGHELKTPLSVLIGETEVALASPTADAAEYREALEHIRAQGDQLQRRMADLLALARSEDGRLQMQREEVDLVELCRTTLEATRGFARVNEVRLRLHAGVTELPALVDPDRLRQALSALIDNAIKFSPAGADVELRIEASEGRVRLEVADRGPGVPDEDLPRITEAYYQGTGNPARGGTGLGLAVAQWIAGQHGGFVNAQPREGSGLVVTLELPAVAR
jgi:signal transduction histidine kinase